MTVFVVVRIIECRGASAEQFITVFGTRDEAETCVERSIYHLEIREVFV